MFKNEARTEWNEARRKAFLSRLSSYVTRRDVRLRDFEDISRQLKLRNPRYKGVEEIPLDKIVGSVGRYNDFVSHFLPVTPQMEERWQRIARLYLDPASGGVPPIEVYRVGDSYFVKDGNHRVSVCKQLNTATIDAVVWEYPVPVSGSSDHLDIDTLLIEAEKLDFFSFTQLDESNPDHEIAVTLPGGYRELLHQVVHYREILEEIDEEEKTIEAAADAWYAMMYEPALQIIEREGVLRQFPDRTPTDLFIWTRMEYDRLE
ncbi:MAG TPA: hypothetical protein VJZ27_17315, partial [Aggregatilineales bacterium]|nr:hypothetical protein [Aggregatilineales bacterium]